MATTQPQRDVDEYPHAIQAAGERAMRLFDQVIAGMMSEGYTEEEADMLAHINLDQILAKVNEQGPVSEMGQQ